MQHLRGLFQLWNIKVHVELYPPKCGWTLHSKISVYIHVENSQWVEMRLRGASLHCSAKRDVLQNKGLLHTGLSNTFEVLQRRCNTPATDNSPFEAIEPAFHLTAPNATLRVG